MASELVHDCTQMLASAQDGDRLVKTVHDVLALLEQRGHVYSMQLKPALVGISPLNRDGSGVNAVDVHELLSDIVSAGWLDSRVTAIAVEPTGQHELEWNAQFFHKADGILGAVDPASLKALSLAGSHTNCALRCLAQEVPHVGDEIICHEGKLRMALLQKHDSNFHRAANDGVVWRVISRAAALALPQLLSLVQRMGNATLQRGEHELQLMRRLHALWVQHSSQGPVDFPVLKSKITTGKSVHIRALPHIYNFVLRAGGGRDPFLLNETESYVRLHSPSTRSLTPTFWERVAAQVKGSNQFPRFRHAVVTWPH